VIVEWRIRKDTAAGWESANPVLADGEPGWDKANRLMKIGDGVTPWNDLLAYTTPGPKGDKGDPGEPGPAGLDEAGVISVIQTTEATTSTYGSVLLATEADIIAGTGDKVITVARLADLVVAGSAPPGSGLYVQWNGTDWIYNGAPITARPSVGGDVRFIFVDLIGTSTRPAWAANDVDLGLKPASP
jgi:hypothetical protein